MTDGKNKDKAAVKRLERLVGLPDGEWEDHDKVWNLLSDLFATLGSLMSKQAPLATWVKPRGDRTVADFRAWFQAKSGLDLSDLPVDVRVSGDNGELFAKRAITKGEELLRIPQSAMLTENDLPAALRSEPMLQRMPHLGMAVYIALQMSDPTGPLKDGGFRPYLAMFPSSFSCAVQFDMETLQCLDGSEAQALAIRRLRSHARQYCHLRGVLNRSGATPGRALNYALFTWAVGAVSTRQNAIPSGWSAGGATMVAMIPVWDMANHPDDLAEFRGAEDGMTTSFDAEDRALTFTAMEATPCDGAIQMFYGPRGNQALLLHAGFTVANNPFDTVTVELPVLADELRPLRLLALKQLGVDCATAPSFIAVHAGRGGAWPEPVERIADALVMDRGEAAAWLRAPGDAKPRLTGAGRDRAAALLDTAVQRRLAQYSQRSTAALCAEERALLRSLLTS